MINGQNTKLMVLVSCLLKFRIDEKIPRFRDIFIKDKDFKLPEHLEDRDCDFIILTRMGGGNYKCWNNSWEPDCDCPYHRLCRLEKEPWYMGGFDNNFDETYRFLLVKLDPEQKALYDKIVINGDEEAFNSLKGMFDELFGEI